VSERAFSTGQVRFEERHGTRKNDVTTSDRGETAGRLRVWPTVHHVAPVAMWPPGDRCEVHRPQEEPPFATQ
jgi:hypothetical protein